jgi:RNA-directed DNA polymerase
MSATKVFDISKHLVMEAFQAVKANAGTAGVDLRTIADFEQNLQDNLYKLWNRMSSGSYFPPPVKAVSIPKKNGGERILGIPTVGDRVAQMVAKRTFEPLVEPFFLPDSYGYRPGKSALDAVAVTRRRCWQYDWVLEFDIKGLFDNIDHDLLMKAVKKHTECRWVVLYIERWLTAPLQKSDGSLVKRTRGTPQGGVISPVLANLFLHYTFDIWMMKSFPGIEWCRYADDGLVHCRTEMQAQTIKSALAARFAECGLEMHPTKTKIVYCKDENRKRKYPNTQFEFLGYTFRPRGVKTKYGNLFIGFTPAVGTGALRSLRQTTRKWNLRNRADLSIDDISELYNPVIRGWMAYYGRFCPSAMAPALQHFNNTLVAWVRRKYKSLKQHKRKASLLVEDIARRQPHLFAHWERGFVETFA